MSESKVALVTGGASGLGRSAALLFAAKGCNVCIADVQDEKGHDTCKHIEESAGVSAKFIHTDVSKEADVKAMVDFVKDNFGRLDYAFDNAGTAFPKPQHTWEAKFIHEVPMESYDDMMGINTRGVFMCLKHQIPLMLATSEAPAIVITASTAGHLPGPATSMYCMSKWALRGLAATAAKEYGPLGLRVNCIAPGWVNTPMVHGHDWAPVVIDIMKGPQLEVKGHKQAAADLSPAALAMELNAGERILAMNKDKTGSLPDALMGQVALGRIASPEEIVKLVVWLCMEGTYATGQSYVIDGGVTCHP